MKTSRRFFFVALAFICMAAQASAQTKVLFLGNSITKHGPKADIDWKGNWGMAASAEANDYVHLVTKGLTDKAGAAPEVMVKNIADFERAYAGYDVPAKLKEAIDFHADLIILAIGENVPALKTAEDKAKLQASVTTLLNALKAGKKPIILVRSCFWANAAKDEALSLACSAVEGVYVDISTLGKDESNYARSERPYKHAGVANHPGDKGMAAIAAALLKAFP
ncbi:SGNH/GDSL hydrolase family protein [Prosthecobacter vanneervenii]|uniref:Alpha-galactosidase n=1 Tax=Prosthecobacter vanneervenii TaxID=48466 RepID=A0A7W7YFR0_9BACT|nr:SGNH/GDSL hydrolase family protein [Prosthecobacter vanneervenii]MBB5035274.1 alpha-galactosidase [Prosthecobacter vanneervenii]